MYRPVRYDDVWIKQLDPLVYPPLEGWRASMLRTYFVDELSLDFKSIKEIGCILVQVQD